MSTIERFGSRSNTWIRNSQEMVILGMQCPSICIQWQGENIQVSKMSDLNFNAQRHLAGGRGEREAHSRWIG